MAGSVHDSPADEHGHLVPDDDDAGQLLSADAGCRVAPGGAELRSPDFGGEWDRATLRRLQQGYEQVAETYIERHRQGEEIYFSAFDEKIRTHALGPIRRGTICDMGANSFSVAPSGEIYPCVQFVKPETDLRFRIGDVRAGFDSPRRRALVEMNRKPRPGCEGCDLDGRCNNWCGCVNHRTTGDVLEVPPAPLRARADAHADRRPRRQRPSRRAQRDLPAQVPPGSPRTPLNQSPASVFIRSAVCLTPRDGNSAVGAKPGSNRGVEGDPCRAPDDRGARAPRPARVVDEFAPY